MRDEVLNELLGTDLVVDAGEVKLGREVEVDGVRHRTYD